MTSTCTLLQQDYFLDPTYSLNLVASSFQDLDNLWMSIGPTSPSTISTASTNSNTPSISDTAKHKPIQSPNLFDIESPYQPMEIDSIPYTHIHPNILHHSASAPPSTYDSPPSLHSPSSSTTRHASEPARASSEGLTSSPPKYTRNPNAAMLDLITSNPARYSYPPTDLPAVPLRGMSPFAAPTSKRQTLSNRGYEYLEEELEPRLAKNEALIRQLLKQRGRDTLQRVTLPEEEEEDDNMAVDLPPFTFQSHSDRKRGKNRFG